MPRILVIDDDEPVLGFVEEVLKRAGYAVRTAQDGSKGLKLAKVETFDLVITDLFMPEKEGCETIVELRRLAPQTKIIAVSGGCRINGADCLPIAKALGAAVTLKKPVTSKELLDAVHGVLGAEE
jgi:two-component system, chemotaxis family, chemotaxis protein CheY